MNPTDTGFAQGFYQATGRNPTQEDFQSIRDRNQRAFDARYPKPPGTAERVAAIASPFITYAGQKGVDALFGAGVNAAAPALGLGGASTGASLGTAALPTYSSPLASASFGLGGPTTATGVGGTGAGALGAGSALGLAGTGAFLGGLGYTGYQAYDAIKGGNRNGAQKFGAGLGGLAGMAFGPVGSTLGAGLGAGLGKALTGGKDQHQKGRDDIRDTLQRTGVIDDNYLYKDTVDIGKDGGFRFDDGRKVYEVIDGQEDGAVWEDQDIAESVGKLNPLGFLLSDGDDDASGHSTGMLHNLLAESGDDGVTNTEISGLYDELGLTGQEVASALNILEHQGDIDSDELAAFENAITDTFGAGEIDPNISFSEQANQARKVREILFG